MTPAKLLNGKWSMVTAGLPFTTYHRVWLLTTGQVLQCRPAWINILSCAGTVAGIFVDAAVRTDAFAVGPAEHSCWYCQQDLLFYDLVNVDRIAVEHGNRHLVFGQLGGAAGFVGGAWDVLQIEICVDRRFDVLQTAIALDLGARFDVSVDKDLGTGEPDLSSNVYWSDYLDAFVKTAQFIRLVHVSEISSSMFQIYQLNPHRTWHSHE